GISVVLITHFMDEAVQADRVLVMEEGRLLFEGTPRQVFAQVERLKEIHLDVPQVTELASVLAAQELPLRRDILSVEEMVQALEEAWGQ
ncbi:MAG: energy-coupling factor transporter ATPase, partial [Bacillota bacterium]|nr:energy-coupling factor transporter ATPase [Bacillota bacterium]